MSKINLRPQSFCDFIGQSRLIQTLKAMIASSKIKNKPLAHILFYGSPGMGKTTLATIIAHELNQKIHYVQGANIEKKADILSILSLLNEGDILFIDEIHSVNKLVIEFLYSAMEEFVFDLIIGKEGNSRAVRMKVKPFTLIGATTKINELTQPFKDRFGYIARLTNYCEKDILKILKISAKKMQIQIDQNFQKQIASYSRYTPRVANHLLERVYDFALAENQGIINEKIIKKTFKSLDLYQFGLTKDHIEYLNILNDGFNRSYVSLDTIIGLTAHNKDTLINEIEPILLYHKFIDKNSRGRKITKLGVEYLKSQL
ncbi:Holliday junction branch migration DNA helicase RuvB [Mycoplasmopsis gallopavonis]|uniref:Holliday junction branch migration complex subunit RuvB n=1 Tax=Mycoplasmopsis gallopavonis TaxID=76629 RepID=A0A449B0J1_9BACT|nr:Holliday junction branch migration DNA helicase RuvB [Mycoplasmopsis gallopavonis]RIV16761.1 Holliday junction branch migration DNA helicase RuvB [Mycoplasmopsis gallopavonis]VEU73256.1 Holliday junction ATP-dependent DNA helicase RuvB [Mycoplasmopsis gallopavonis]